MPELNISPDFTIEDIRKVRDYDYEITKNMSKDERRAYYREEAMQFLKEMEERKDTRARQKLVVNS